MRFKDKLKRLMNEQGLNATQVCKLTGICAPSISNYLAGHNEPAPAKKRAIATALGVQETYFEQLDPEPEIKTNGINLPVATAAKLLGKSVPWVCQGLQQNVFPWGYAVKMKGWSYFISSIKFSEATGIQLPGNQTTETAGGSCCA